MQCSKFLIYLNYLIYVYISEDCFLCTSRNFKIWSKRKDIVTAL